MAGVLRRGHWRNREANAKGTAFARCAFNLDFTTQRRNKALRYAQSETRAPDIPVIGTVTSHEVIENLRLKRFVHTNARIADAYL